MATKSILRKFRGVSRNHCHNTPHYYASNLAFDPEQGWFTADVCHVFFDDCEEVRMEIDGSDCRANCSCGDFSEGSTDCVHVRALIKAIDESGFSWPEGELWLRRPDASMRWRAALSTVAEAASSESRRIAGPRTQFRYIIDLEETVSEDTLNLALAVCRRKKDGHWSQPRGASFGYKAHVQAPTPEDAEMLKVLGVEDSRNYHFYGGEDYAELPNPLHRFVLESLAKRGVLYWRLNGEEEPAQWRQLVWSDRPYQLQVDTAWDGGRQGWALSGRFFDGVDQASMTEPVLLLVTGLLLLPDRVAPLEVAHQAFSWARALRADGEIFIPEDDSQELLDHVWSIPGASQLLNLPPQLQYEQQPGTPMGCVRIGQPPRGRRELPVEVQFDYDGRRVDRDGGGDGVVDHEQRRVLLRDSQAEQQLMRTLGDAHIMTGEDSEMFLLPPRLPLAVRVLTEADWQVEAEGKLLRRPGAFHASLKSGLDWFDLDGKFDFGEQSVPLPRLLSAVRRGEKYVALDDGSHGLLPEEWLQKYGSLAGLGEADGDSLRFSMPQAALLDALLAAQENVSLDAKFRRFRDQLARFRGVQAAAAPATFAGQLRDYQQEGLGWLRFLRKFQLGGCLADDMGLGKTIQVLALLEGERRRRRRADEPRLPSLIVVPRTLMFNWQAEAQRFTPRLRLLRYFGPQRGELRDELDEHDAIVTTYGIVRRDIGELRNQSFHYVVLDEAQAIKNANSQSAKACRLLQGRHRLALTGTPVENHLGELWSLFEFLNPGMLGRNESFSAVSKEARASEPARQQLARAIRPYVLRRTKEQVLSELPEKSEQTIYCEMGAAQRRHYNELRDYYRSQLASKVAAQGLKRSKIQVLEALLRLRQCACHPGLLDPDTRAGSAKLDSLMAQLTELCDEGHKALVFSQFTKLLAIVRRELDQQQLAYEYLDGRTRKREEKVRRFQQDDQCPLFLISLKAGGHGLNLTAADYVFILDPWWNPAVESQAIDRAHRIGQERRVFAYRLICRDSVEEKIVDLQSQKRELADAIINADNSLMRDLTADDLQLLLS